MVVHEDAFDASLIAYNRFELNESFFWRGFQAFWGARQLIITRTIPL
ncbi:MAG: hypothetical protein ACK5MA_11520 [Parachlamydiaceae bacterium]